ncbi:MAG TPA: NAD(P)/FAD-dependent oxidoreductase [Dehalococcoidia bacterium]|nr:NAD(P)/FAD-dependent oxidoreductase [Dehalococcoidia bacterium]
MPDRIDITIIGAGIIGLAVAAEVSGNRRQVFVLEQNERFGMETSSRSSEVLHSGIYYPPDSLKAITCVRGNALIYERCRKYGIGYTQPGKLIVATNKNEIGRLEWLFQRGINNGVKKLKLLSAREVKNIEPNVEAAAAIYSPSTGIVDSYALMGYFLTHAREKGADFVYRSEVTAIDKTASGYLVTVADDSGYSSFKTAVVINCAGLESDCVAAMSGVHIDEYGYKIHYRKGEYFSVAREKCRLIGRLIYPLPETDDTGLGVHTNLNLEGKMRLGPNSIYVNEIDYTVDETHREAFAQSVKKFLPFIEADDLDPDTAGIRPTLQKAGGGFRDFIIAEESGKGLPGLINLVGIESPGLTSAPAIAEMVSDMVSEIL